MELNRYIDHTLLKSTATTRDIETLCKEAIEYQFFGVCIHGSYLKLAKRILKDSGVKLVAVTDFPLGMAQPKAKLEEAVINLQAGADEIDTVLNLGLLKSKNYKAIEEELTSIKTTMGEKILKVIIETCYLTTEEKRVACRLLVNSGVDFVKTSTGFGSGGATIEDVKLIKEEVGNSAKIKASGGIRDLHTAENFIASGADRIGTSSAVSMMKSLTQ